MNYAGLAASLGIKGILAGDELRSPCPLHNDTNPSFSLNCQTGMWICFSKCGSGQFHNLVEQVLGCNLQEAWDWIKNNGRATSVERLSSELAIALGQVPGVNPSIKRQPWLDHYLSLSHNVMPIWFLNRGFNWDTIEEWDIRYDPIMDSVVIPVYWEHNFVGTVIRHTKPGYPKYQNSVDLPRAEILFGQISTNKTSIIICEGLLDVVWLWQNGYNAAGLLGTYMTQAQVNILRRYRYGEIILGHDNDEAGLHGREEAQKRLISSGWLAPQITVLRYPKGKKDPQDCTPEELARIYEDRKGIYELFARNESAPTGMA